MFLKLDVEFHQLYNALDSEEGNKSLRGVLHCTMLFVNFFSNHKPFKTLELKYGHRVCKKKTTTLFVFSLLTAKNL